MRDELASCWLELARHLLESSITSSAHGIDVHWHVCHLRIHRVHRLIHIRRVQIWRHSVDGHVAEATLDDLAGSSSCGTGTLPVHGRPLSRWAARLLLLSGYLNYLIGFGCLVLAVRYLSYLGEGGLLLLLRAGRGADWFHCVGER